MRLIVLAATMFFGGLLVFAACDSGDNGAGINLQLPDGSFGMQDSTLPNPDVSTAADAAAPDAADAAAPDAADAAKPDSACVDAGLAPDAGCYGALPVFNTGVGSTGVADGGAVDPHYTLVKSAESSLPGPDAIVVAQIAAGYWIPQSNESKWIAPSANQAYPGASPCNAAGNYVYRTTFSLDGLDPATATINGRWAADNSGVAVRLNGASLGITAGGYSPYTPFTIASGFSAGMNTLEFEINDLGCPNGLRVEMSGFARRLP